MRERSVDRRSRRTRLRLLHRRYKWRPLNPRSARAPSPAISRREIYRRILALARFPPRHLLAFTPAPHPSSFSARYTRPQFVPARRDRVLGALSPAVSALIYRPAIRRHGIRKREIPAAAALQIMPRAARVVVQAIEATLAKIAAGASSRPCRRKVKATRRARNLRNLTTEARPLPRYTSVYAILSAALRIDCYALLDLHPAFVCMSAVTRLNNCNNQLTARSFNLPVVARGQQELAGNFVIRDLIEVT